MLHFKERGFYKFLTDLLCCYVFHKALTSAIQHSLGSADILPLLRTACFSTPRFSI